MTLKDLKYTYMLELNTSGSFPITAVFPDIVHIVKKMLTIGVIKFLYISV